MPTFAWCDKQRTSRWCITSWSTQRSSWVAAQASTLVLLGLHLVLPLVPMLSGSCGETYKIMALILPESA